MNCSYVGRKRRNGYSLVETLAVIGILGILLGLLLPAVQRARESAARVQCLNNLKQIGTALHNYHDTYGHLPPGPWIDQDLSHSHDPNFLLTWMASILPQMGEGPLWDRSVQACTIESRTYLTPPHVGYATVIKTYVCPDDGRLSRPLTNSQGPPAAYSSYLGVSGSYFGPGVIGGAPGIRFSAITDGTSQTLMVGERPPPQSLQAGRWYTSLFSFGPNPGPDSFMQIPGSLLTPGDIECASARMEFGPGRIDNPCDRYHFWSLHPGGANFLFADGSARPIRYSASRIMPFLATRAGGEPVELPD